MSKKLRGEMTPEEREEARRAERRRRKLRETGRPRMVPVGPAQRRVRLLHDRGGMTFKEIAEKARLSMNTVSELHRGFRTDGPRRAKGGEILKINRTTEEAILSVPPPVICPTSTALVDPTGTIRRMQALAVGGFGARFIALNGLGHAEANMVWRLMVGKEHASHKLLKVEIATREKVRDFYDKMAGADPRDFGLSNNVIAKTKAWAERNGWAPYTAWDDDTIEDPDAFPEWTGACGTPAGYRVHVRELMQGNDLPICLPCRTAAESRKLGPDRWIFKNQAFAELLAGYESTKAFGRDLKLSGDRQVHLWRNGIQSPTYRSIIEDMASLFGVDVDELLEEFEAPPCGKPRPVVAGAFNPYVARIVLDLGRTSQSAAADICKVSRDTMNNWLFGRAVPTDKSKVARLASHLGIDVEVFYQ